MARTLMLADSFMRSQSRVQRSLVAPRVIEQVRRRLLVAKRFNFDAIASRRLGEVIRDVPNLLIQQQSFARAPYDVMWIEIDFQAFGRELSSYLDVRSDSKVGYLYDHGTVYVAAENSGYPPSLMPIYYQLNTPFEAQEQLDFCAKTKVSPETIDQFFWGKTYEKLDETDRRLLRGRHSCGYLPEASNGKNRSWTVIENRNELPRRTSYEDLFEKMYWGSAGDMRNLIACLLMLNRPRITEYTEVERGHGFIRGKLTTFMAHTTVTIKVDPRPILRSIDRSEAGEPRRRHEVEGHWCHNEAYRDGTKRDCIHAWQAQLDDHPEDDPDAPDHFHCMNCGGKRWWRRAHMRGSAAVGFVEKDYVVTN